MTFSQFPDADAPPPALRRLSADPDDDGARIRWRVEGHQVRAILRLNGVDVVEGGPNGNVHLPGCTRGDELELEAWDHRNRMVTARIRVGDSPLAES